MYAMTEAEITAAVLERLEQTASPRLKTIMRSLVQHLHAFVQEVELTEQEWIGGIRFLTQTGQMCSDTRQEFILLSDLLGVSMLVDLMSHRKPEGATESTVLGPFYRDDAPEMAYGANIAQHDDGPPAFVSGHVLDMARSPIGNAVLDVWQTSSKGLYDVQNASDPQLNWRGKFRTQADGTYRFRTVRPIGYTVPFDGTAGRMLEQIGSHPYRPAHIHCIVSAEGFEPVKTHIFDSTDPYLDSDAVYAVKPSLVCEFVRHDTMDNAPDADVSLPYYTVAYDFVLTPREAAPSR